MHTKELAAILRRAASLVGGPDALAAHLRASPDLLKRWMKGRAGAPTYIFLGAADIIAMHNHSATTPSRLNPPQ